MNWAAAGQQWAFILGLAVGTGIGIQAGRWSLLLLMRRAWRQQESRQRADLSRRAEVASRHPCVEVEHAGQYVQQLRAEGRRAGWSQLDPPGHFTRVRSD